MYAMFETSKIPQDTRPEKLIKQPASQNTVTTFKLQLRNENS